MKNKSKSKSSKNNRSKDNFYALWTLAIFFCLFMSIFALIFASCSKITTVEPEATAGTEYKEIVVTPESTISGTVTTSDDNDTEEGTDDDDKADSEGEGTDEDDTDNETEGTDDDTTENGDDDTDADDVNGLEAD